MSSNYPPGVTESTYGAPWNDQCYEITFRFFIPTDNDMVPYLVPDNNLNTQLVLCGAHKYSDEEIENWAKLLIEDEYEDFLLDYPNTEIQIICVEND